jgi:hypothetical protein
MRKKVRCKSLFLQILDLTLVLEHPTGRSPRSATYMRVGIDNIAPHDNRSHTRTGRYDLSLDGTDERPEKIARKKHNDLAADIEDLDIDMEGWSDVELPGRSTRQTRSGQRPRRGERDNRSHRESEAEDPDTDESDIPPLQRQRKNRAGVPSSSPEPEHPHRDESDSTPVDRRRRAHIVASRPARDGRSQQQSNASESETIPVPAQRRERARAPSSSVDPIRRPANRSGTGNQHLRESTSRNTTSISNAATSVARQPKRQRYAALSPSPIREVREATNRLSIGSRYFRRAHQLQQRRDDTKEKSEDKENPVHQRIQSRMRDLDDDLHRRRDVPRRSVEGAYARQNRAQRRSISQA